MTMHTRIYNPGFLEPEEMDSFVLRKNPGIQHYG